MNELVERHCKRLEEERKARRAITPVLVMLTAGEFEKLTELVHDECLAYAHTLDQMPTTAPLRGVYERRERELWTLWRKMRAMAAEREEV